jgi:hypothetical protein
MGRPERGGPSGARRKDPLTPSARVCCRIRSRVRAFSCPASASSDARSRMRSRNTCRRSWRLACRTSCLCSTNWSSSAAFLSCCACAHVLRSGRSSSLQRANCRKRRRGSLVSREKNGRSRHKLLHPYNARDTGLAFCRQVLNFASIFRSLKRSALREGAWGVAHQAIFARVSSRRLVARSHSSSVSLVV